MNEKFEHVTPIEDQFLHTILDAGKSTIMRMDRALEEVGLSAPKLWAMHLIAREDAPIGLSHLARCMGSVKSNATQLVDRLEADGLVRRIPNPEDRRSVLVELTEEGQQRYKEGEVLRRQIAHELMALFQADEYNALMRLLQTIILANSP